MKEFMPIKELELEEIKERLTITLELPQELEETEILLLGEFNGYGWVHENGGSRPMTAAEIEKYRYKREGNRYQPPEGLSSIVDGGSFKILVQPPAITETELSLVDKISLEELYCAFKQEFRIPNNSVEDHFLGARINKGLRAFLESKGVTNTDSIDQAGLEKALEKFTLSDFDSLWSSDDQKWENEEAESDISSTHQFMHRQLFQVVNNGDREELIKYSEKARKIRHNTLKNAMITAGIPLDNVDEQKITLEDGKNHSKPNYWCTSDNFDKEFVPNYGQQNRFPNL